MLTTIPFVGFCESSYSAAIESEEESFVEYEAEESDLDISDILWRVTSYGIAYRKIAHAYADAFNSQVSEIIGFPLGMTFESMTSPRDYNFDTDRIFCHIPEATVERLYAECDKVKLAEAFKERFTSRSGFSSFYNNTIPVKPLAEWDHNEVSTLLIAVLGEPGDLEESLYCAVCDDGCYSEWESAVDWKKYEELKVDAIAERNKTGELPL